MLNNLTQQPEDKILGLAKLYRADDRPNKLDLGVGVYKDATGLTPIFDAVKLAEKQLWESEITKAYTGLAGDPAFADPDGGDYHIDAGSAALNVGIDTGVTRDIDGDPRPTGDGHDLGATSDRGDGHAACDAR